MKKLILLSGAIALLSLAHLFAVAAAEIREAHIELVQRVDSLEGDLDRQLSLARQDVSLQLAEVRKLVESQASGIRADALARVDASLGLADRRIGDSLRRLDDAIAEVHGLRQDVAPILANTKEITEHASEASAILLRRDALPAQLLGVTAAAKATLGETAQTMKEIRKAAPEVSASVVSVSKSAEGVAADVKREADQLVAPKRWWQKVLGPVYTAGRLAAAFL